MKVTAIIFLSTKSPQQRVKSAFSFLLQWEEFWGHVLPSHIRRTARCDSSNFPTIHKIETFPLPEIRAMNGGVWLAIRRLIRGSAFTKASPPGAAWRCSECASLRRPFRFLAVGWRLAQKLGLLPMLMPFVQWLVTNSIIFCQYDPTAFADLN